MLTTGAGNPAAGVGRGITTMKKYVLMGLFVGTAITLLLFYLRQKKFEGTEFRDFFDSSAIADDLFGNAFDELPDKL